MGVKIITKKKINTYGAGTIYKYNYLGRVAGVIDGLGNERTYQYDELGRLVKETDPLGAFKSYEYYKNGNLVVFRDELSRPRSFSYDKLNRLIKTHDIGMEKKISYTYDAGGNRTALSWLDDQREISYTYGRINELVSVTDPDGKTTTYEYDLLGREIRKSLSKKDWGQNKRLKSLGYLYNAAGEQIYQVEEDGEITAYEYDDLGRVKNVFYPWMSSKKNEDFRERLELGLYPDYKAGKKDEYYFGLPYLPLGRRGEKQFKNNLKGLLKEKDEIFKDYRKLDKKLKGRWNVGIGEGATEFALRLDVPYEVEQALRESYGQIAQKQGNFDIDQWMWTESFSYDVNSNRTSKANGWGRIDYSYNPANEILTAGNRAYEHDLNGNLIKETLGEIEALYTHTPENRIAGIYSKIPGFIGEDDDGWSLEEGVEYTYDAFGRRSSREEYRQYSKTMHGHGDKEWFRERAESYLYDGLSFDVLAGFGVNEGGKRRMGRDSIRWQKNRYKPVSEYIYGNGSIIVRTDLDEQDSRAHGMNSSLNSIFYYHQDILGSTMMLTDHKGKVRETYSYDAFGNRYDDVRSHPFVGHHGNRWPSHRVNEYLYNGKRFDPAAGLYNYGFRDYKPILGRWTTVDPIHAGLNWYVYVNNDPVNYIDLLGIDNITLTFNRSTNQMKVQYDVTTSYGKLLETFPKTYTATNDVKTPEERGNTPVTYDPDNNPATDNSYNYFPQKFPESPPEGWQLGHSYESSNPYVGPAIPTNSNQDVTTYDQSGQVSGTVNDTGYYIHGGIGNTTWDCIKMGNEDIQKVQKLTDSALGSGGNARLFTTGGKND